jgi:hypothetical protein
MLVLTMTIRARLADRIVAALVSDPVVAVIAGAGILAALGSWLGWWSIAVLAGAVVVDRLRWPAAWRSR